MRIRKAIQATACVAEGASALPSLTLALAHRKETVRRAAAWALGEIGDPRAEQALRVALNDPDWLVVRNALAALTKLYPNTPAERTLTRITALLTHPEPPIRAETLSALATWGIHEPLEGCLDDPTPCGLSKFEGRTVGELAAHLLAQKTENTQP